MRLICDENIPFVHRFFDGFGEVRAVPGRTLDAAQLRDADALIVRSVTKVNEALLEGSNVKFVGTCTIGTDHLDTAYLRQRGIAWASAPGCNAGGVVQYVLAALARLRPRWRELRVGVVGAGGVGGRLIRTLQALGVECVAYDPLLPPEPHLTGLDQVLRCDVICLHTPLTRTGPYPTYHMIGDRELEAIAPGALLLNGGRGGAIDSAALKRRLAAAPLDLVLDVWEHEPEIDAELLRQVRLGSPHIAGYSFEGKVNGAAMVYEALAEFTGLSAPVAQARCRGISQTLKGPPTRLYAEDLNSAILATYPITRDHADLLAALPHGAARMPGPPFDALRKHYPERREFEHFCLCSGVPDLDADFNTLGFNAHAACQI